MRPTHTPWISVIDPDPPPVRDGDDSALIMPTPQLEEDIHE